MGNDFYNHVRIFGASKERSTFIDDINACSDIKDSEFHNLALLMPTALSTEHNKVFWVRMLEIFKKPACEYIICITRNSVATSAFHKISSNYPDLIFVVNSHDRVYMSFHTEMIIHNSNVLFNEYCEALENQSFFDRNNRAVNSGDRVLNSQGQHMTYKSKNIEFEEDYDNMFDNPDEIMLTLEDKDGNKFTDKMDDVVRFSAWDDFFEKISCR